MKNNKLICIVLALLVCLTIAVSASATTKTNTNLTFKLESSLDSSQGLATTVAPGAEFTVNVVLEENPGVKFYIAYLNYNAENLDLTKIESKNNNVTVEKSLAKDGRLVVTVGDTAALIGGGEVITDTGVVAELTFKVKATDKDITTGNSINLEVNGNNVVDANGNIGTKADVKVSEVEPIVPTVVGKNHVCDQNSLIKYGAKDATCTEKGYEGDMICPICNKVNVEGKEIATKGHDLDQENFEVKTEPTCDTDGVKILHCKNCEYTKEAPIAAHDHDYQTVKGYAATCEDAGLTDGEQCSICNAWKTEQEEIPALGHKDTLKVTIVAPSCENAGSGVYKCETCQREVTDVIEATGHTPVDVEKKDATCTEAGYEAGKVCSVCDKVLEGKTEIAAKGHSWNAGEITTEATCKAEGVKTYTCSICGETKTESIAKLNEHTWDAGGITTNPTCAEAGARTYTCIVCGETKVESISATGAHIYGEWKVTTEATTEAEGVETHECSVCGAKETRSIEKLPEPENNTVLIVVVVAVVVLAGAGVAAYFVLKNKKK